MSEAIPILPMQEALNFWKKKISISPKAFKRLREEYHIRAFTVAKLAQIDQIEAVRKSIGRALKTGQSMGEWRAENEDLFVRGGWTGKTRYRLDSIFRTNIMTAYNAGRWKQSKDGKKERPYAMYDAINDGRARPSHLAQDGKIYPLDSAFWRMWWPPNGERCRCSIITLSPEEVRERGLKILDRDSKEAAKDISTRPDKNFGFNPGLKPFQVKLQKYSPDTRENFLSAMGNQDFPPSLLKKILRQRDLSDIETLRWVAAQGKIQDFGEWAMVVLCQKGGGGGKVHPVGKIPAHVLRQLPRRPRLATVVMEDAQIRKLYENRGAARGKRILRREIRSLPEYFSGTGAKWFWDERDENLILSLQRSDGTRLNLVIDMEWDFGESRQISAIRVVLAQLRGREPKSPRYKKI